MKKKVHFSFIFDANYTYFFITVLNQNFQVFPHGCFKLKNKQTETNHNFITIDDSVQTMGYCENSAVLGTDSQCYLNETIRSVLKNNCNKSKKISKTKKVKHFMQKKKKIFN